MKISIIYASQTGNTEAAAEYKLSNFFSFPPLISRPKVCISHFP